MGDPLCLGGDGIIQDSQAETLSCFKQPMNPFLPVVHEFKQELLFVTTVGDMPDISRYKISIGSWHDYGLLTQSICWAKWGG